MLLVFSTIGFHSAQRLCIWKVARPIATAALTPNELLKNKITVGCLPAIQACPYARRFVTRVYAEPVYDQSCKWVMELIMHTIAGVAVRSCVGQPSASLAEKQIKRCLHQRPLTCEDENDGKNPMKGQGSYWRAIGTVSSPVGGKWQNLLPRNFLFN